MSRQTWVVAVFVAASHIQICGASISGRCDRGDSSTTTAADPAVPSSRLWPMDGEVPGGGCHAGLASLSADIKVAASLAHVVVNHTYINDLAHAIADAAWLLSVPSGALLTSFQANVGQRVVTAEVREVGKDLVLAVCQRDGAPSSFGLYDSAPQQGSQRVQVGRIEAGEHVVVQAHYMQELKAKWEPGQPSPTFRLQIQVPAATRRKTMGGASGSSTTPAMTVVIRVANNSGTQTAITSPSAGVQLDNMLDDKEASSDDAVAVTAKKMTSKSLQDVTFEMSVGKHEQQGDKSSHAQQQLVFVPQVLLERRTVAGRDTLAAAVALPASLLVGDASTYEVVLILDQSSSMRGVRLSRVQKAARTFVQSLPSEARVNLVGFAADGASADVLFKDGSRQLDEATFKAAVAHIGVGDVGLAGRSAQPQAPPKSVEQAGGILNAIEAAVTLSRSTGTQLRMVVITDRHATDAEDAIRFVEERCGVDCQLSALGLGWGASPPFVEGLAKAGRGTANFVAERGGAAALARVLVTQLAEGLQPSVRDVTIEWAEAGLSSSSAQDVVRLDDLSVDDEGLMNKFTEAGGARTLSQVYVDAPAVASGGRLLSLALLGARSHDDDMFRTSSEVVVRAVVGGKQIRVSMPLPKPIDGFTLHALCASRLVNELSTIPSGPATTRKVRALGLAYGLETQHTHWATSAAGSVEPAADSSKPQSTSTSHCAPGPGARGDSGYSRTAATSGGAGIGSDRSALSVRHPPSSTGEPGDGLPASPIISPKFGAQLSLLDFGNLGSSLSLRHLGGSFSTSKSWRTLEDTYHNSPYHGGGPRSKYGSTNVMDTDKKTAASTASSSTANVASSISLRGNFKKMSVPSVNDAIQVGTGAKSETAKTMPYESPALPDSEQGFAAMHRWFDGEQDDFGDSMDMLATTGARIDDVKLPKTRNVGRIGDSLSAAPPIGRSAPPQMTSTTRPPPPSVPADEAKSTPKAPLSAQISVLDFANLGSSLSLKTNRPSGPDYGKEGGFGSVGGGAFGRDRGSTGGSLSTLDCLFLGSSLALGGLGLGKKSMYGSDRAGDGMDAFDYWGDAYGGPLGSRRDGQDAAGKTKSDNLSVRSMVKLSNSLSAMNAAAEGASDAVKAVAGAVAGKLSLVDFANLGASLSLRSVSAKRDGKSPYGAGSMGGRGGFGSDLGGFGAEPYDRYPDALDPYGASSDPFAYRGGLDGAAADHWRGGRGDEMVPGAASGPSAYIGIGIAGGMIAPVLGIWRMGGSCQTAQETVMVQFQLPAVGVSPAVSFYSAQGPVVAGGVSAAEAKAAAFGGGDPSAAAVLVATVVAPASKKQGETSADQEFRLSVHMSHQCELSARLLKSSSSTKSSSSYSSYSSYGARNAKAEGKEFLVPTKLPSSGKMLNDLFGDSQGRRNEDAALRAMDEGFGMGGAFGDFGDGLGMDAFGDGMGMGMDVDAFGMADPLDDLRALEGSSSSSSSSPSASSVAPFSERLRDALAVRRAITVSGGSPLVCDVPFDVQMESSSSSASSIGGYSVGGFGGDDPEASRLHSLLAAQLFDGSFDLQRGSSSSSSAPSSGDTSTLGGLDSSRSSSTVGDFGVSRGHLNALVSAWRTASGESSADKGSDRVALAQKAAHTATALATLRLEHAAHSGSWMLLALKAEQWLLDSGAADVSGCGSAHDCVDAADVAVARWGMASARRHGR